MSASLKHLLILLARAWQLGLSLLPMTDDRFRTLVVLADTGEEVSFQDYFVRLRHSVPVAGVRFEHTGAALTVDARSALAEAAAVVIAPSNPVVSIGPIRALPGVDDLLATRRDTVVAVSPIVAGSAVKGPADRMLAELGVEPSVVGVAELYAPIASVLVIDPADADLAGRVEAAGMRCVVTPTVMSQPGVAGRLADVVVASVNAAG